MSKSFCLPSLLNILPGVLINMNATPEELLTTENKVEVHACPMAQRVTIQLSTNDQPQTGVCPMEAKKKKGDFKLES